MHNYDILVFYSGDYLSGSFYDAFEYYCLLATNGVNVGLLVITDIDKEKILKSLSSRS